MGELSSVSETEGVSFVEWELLKVPDCTPFAAARSTIPKGGSERGRQFILASGEKALQHSTRYR